MALLIVTVLVLAVVAAAAERRAVIAAVDRAASELHVRLSALETQLKEKL